MLERPLTIAEVLSVSACLLTLVLSGVMLAREGHRLSDADPYTNYTPGVGVSLGGGSQPSTYDLQRTIANPRVPTHDRTEARHELHRRQMQATGVHDRSIPLHLRQAHARQLGLTEPSR